MEFSIIIPVAPDRNADVLECLKEVDYSKEKFEIIVEPGSNPSKQRDMGIKKAKYEKLVFLDDDAYIESDFLSNIKNFFDKYPDYDIVGGVQLTPDSDSKFSKISGIALSSFFGAYRMKNRYIATKLNLDACEKDITSAICIIKKSVFNKISSFNPKYFPGEDPDLFIRAKEKNCKIAYDPNIKIYHKRRPSFLSFVEQIYFYGKVRPRISKNILSSVFIFPSLFLIYLVFLPALIFFHWLFLLPLLMYIILAILSSLYESIKAKDPLAFVLLPFLYLAMHLTYGIGYIYGLFERIQFN